jgi:hypothetical protein
LLAQAIVRDGIDGTPKPELTPGKKVPHFIVKTKTGATYQVKVQGLPPKTTITVKPVPPPQGG